MLFFRICLNFGGDFPKNASKNRDMPEKMGRFRRNREKKSRFLRKNAFLRKQRIGIIFTFAIRKETDRVGEKSRVS